jgi:hypothetical protein
MNFFLDVSANLQPSVDNEDYRDDKTLLCADYALHTVYNIPKQQALSCYMLQCPHQNINSLF